MKRLFLGLTVGMMTACACVADQVTIQQGKRDFRRVTSDAGMQREVQREADPTGVAWSPAMLSLATPLQVPSADWDVAGLRINLIYGECVNFDGLDISVVGRAKGHANGIQLALLANVVDGSSMSLQIAPVNVVQGSYAGLQIGAVNYASSLPGAEAQTWQIGIYNGSDYIKGFQLGVINYAGAMYGVQIGLVNIIQNKDIAFLPIINAAF
jgi:hypothetical protein